MSLSVQGGTKGSSPSWRPGSTKSRNSLTSGFQSYLQGGNELPGSMILNQLVSGTGPFGGELAKLLQTGSPTDTSDAYLSRKNLLMRDINDVSRGVGESYGAQGIDFGSDVLRAQGEVRGRALQDFAGTELDRIIGTQEAARGRQLSMMDLFARVLQPQAGIASMGRFGQIAPFILDFLRSSAGISGGGSGPSYSGSYSYQGSNKGSTNNFYGEG